MNKELKIALLNKQNEVYEILISKLQKAIPVIEKFDGKMLNVKLNRELEALEEKEIRLRNNNTCLSVGSWNNRSIQYGTKMGGCTHYVNVYDWEVKIIVDNKRVSAAATIEVIKKDIETIRERISNKKKAIADYDKMVADYLQIEKMIKEFKSNYDYSIREDFKFN